MRSSVPSETSDFFTDINKITNTQSVNTDPQLTIKSEFRKKADEIILKGVPKEEVTKFLLSIQNGNELNFAKSHTAFERQLISHSKSKKGIDLNDHFNVTLPNGYALSSWQSGLFLATLHATPMTMSFALLIDAAILMANNFKVTIGIGTQFTGGAGGGVSLGGGILVAPGGILGIYGSASANIGWFASLSGTLVVTTIFGGIDDFAGQSVGLNGSISIPGGTVGGALLFRSIKELQAGTIAPFGFVAELGPSLGLPNIEVFISLNKTGVPWQDAISQLEDK